MRESTARSVVNKWGAGSQVVRVLLGASRANVADMGHDEAFRTVDSLMPPASVLQLGPQEFLAIVIPGEDRIRVSLSVLDETFYHALLGHEVMCS